MSDRTPSPSPPLEPQHLRAERPSYWPEDYARGEPLGEGSFGEVFEAIHERTGERVALKLVERSEEARKRHTREVRRQRELDSPHVMKVLDSGDGWHTMPVAEASLGRRIGELNQEECVDVLVHSARGLLAAHGRNLVHRDVSPGNLLLMNGLWLVSDFGMVSNPRGETSSAPTERVVGTRAFRAPEMETIAAKEIDHRADIYALGRVLRYALTGDPGGDVPGPWRSLIDQMTVHHREHRTQTLTDVLNAELSLLVAIRESRKERWRQRGASIAPIGIPEMALRVMRWIYGLDPNLFALSELRQQASGQVSPQAFNLGWQELRRRGLTDDLRDQNGEIIGYRVTDEGENWARENASALIQGAQNLPVAPPAVAPPGDDDAPF